MNFVLQPCDGLALAIETEDAARTRSLCEQYIGAIRSRADVDTLVLGCTHYALVEDVLRSVAGPGVQIVEPGMPVARRVAALVGG